MQHNFQLFHFNYIHIERFLEGAVELLHLITYIMYIVVNVIRYCRRTEDIH